MYYCGENGTVKVKPFHSSCCDPSRADAEINDPTITRCINFALSWGYGRLEIVNLFAYRTSKPSLLKQAAEPIGKDNDRFILESVEKCDRIILAWGNHGTWRKQNLYTLQLLKDHNYLYSLGITALSFIDVSRFTFRALHENLTLVSYSISDRYFRKSYLNSPTPNSIKGVHFNQPSHHL